MITKDLPEFKAIWKAIELLYSKNRSPHTQSSILLEIEQIDRELINIIKLIERGDSLLPDDCEG